jgi:transposase
MADLAWGRARAAAKMADLSMALEGRFTDHHALMCRLHLVTPRTLRCWQS